MFEVVEAAYLRAIALLTETEEEPENNILPYVPENYVFH